MSQGKVSDMGLNRRQLLVLAAGVLSGCGGGGQQVAGLPGTGGTGIYVLGSISGFGSVIVNGIKFDDRDASIQIEGQAGAPADLRLGMVASVQGTRTASALTGVAGLVEVWSVAQGEVSGVQAGQFTVAGMTVQTDNFTVFDGINSATPLANGARVTVWGLQASALGTGTGTGTVWTATRVASTNATAVVSTGLVHMAGALPYLNGLRLGGSAAAGLADGLAVRVVGSLQAGPVLQITSLRQLDVQAGTPPTGEVEMEGLVTAVISASRFMLGLVEVDASSATVSPAGTTITPGLRLEVEGRWQGWVLKAQEVSVKTAQSLEEVEITGAIEQFTSQADFVVRGQRCNATGVHPSGGSASGLALGVRVKVHGTKAGDVLTVTELEFAD